jgi:hypothetical protein
MTTRRSYVVGMLLTMRPWNPASSDAHAKESISMTVYPFVPKTNAPLR